MKKIIVLKKDGTYVPISNPTYDTKLADKDIQMILIPSYDYPNSFIPIKPNLNYCFKRAVVEMLHGMIEIDMDSDRAITSTPVMYKKECHNIIDFINAIYNIMKFTKFREFIGEYSNYGFQGTTVWGMVAYELNISMYDSHDRIFHQYHKDVTSEIFENLNVHYIKNSAGYDMMGASYNECALYQYPTEDGFNSSLLESLTDMLYTGVLPRDNPPYSIRLADDYWYTVEKPGKEGLKEHHQIMLYNDIVGSYLVINYGFYLRCLTAPDIDIAIVSISNPSSDPIDKYAMENMLEIYHTTGTIEDMLVELNMTFTGNFDIISTALMGVGTVSAHIQAYTNWIANNKSSVLVIITQYDPNSSIRTIRDTHMITMDEFDIYKYHAVIGNYVSIEKFRR